MQNHHYSYQSVRDRIRTKVISEIGDTDSRGHKAVYDDERVKITKDAWSRKWRGAVEFSLEEITRLADFFNAPPGWPFIDWELGDSIEKAFILIGGSAVPVEKQAPRVESPCPQKAAPSGPPGRRKTSGR